MTLLLVHASGSRRQLDYEERRSRFRGGLRACLKSVARSPEREATQARQHSVHGK
jgi:hypothetical protein